VVSGLALVADGEATMEVDLGQRPRDHLPVLSVLSEPATEVVAASGDPRGDPTPTDVAGEAGGAHSRPRGGRPAGARGGRPPEGDSSRVCSDRPVSTRPCTPLSRAHSPSPGLPTTSQSGWPSVASRADCGGGTPTCPLAANRVTDASTSPRCRAPTRGPETPMAARSSVPTRPLSDRRDRAHAAARPSALARSSGGSHRTAYRRHRLAQSPGMFQPPDHVIAGATTPGSDGYQDGFLFGRPLGDAGNVVEQGGWLPTRLRHLRPQLTCQLRGR